MLRGQTIIAARTTMLLFLQYLLTFCLAAARPELGLVLLTFTLASFGPPWGHTSIPGFGSLQLSDFAMLGLTLNLICSPRPWRNPKYVIWFVIVLWIFSIALIHGATQAGGLKVAYKLGIRYGLLWLIPIIVAELTTAKRRTLLLGMLICGALVTGVQAYAYVKRDPSFAAKMYYQFQDRPSYQRPEADARREFRHNAFPRLYPRGALLVQSLLVFVLVNHMLSRRLRWSNWPRAALFCIYSLFFISLRQRSSVISLAVTLCLFLMWTPSGSRRLRAAAKAVTIVMAGAIAVLAYQAVTGASFVDDFTKRFQNESIVEQHNRIHDNWLALKVIQRSPLTGTAAFDVEDLALEEGGESLGLDVNPVLLVPILGGLPLLLLVLVAAWQCGKRGRLILFRERASDQAIGAVFSVAYMFCVAVLNFAGVFTLAKDMLPMLMFVGIMEGSNQLFLRTTTSFHLNPNHIGAQYNDCASPTHRKQTHSGGNRSH